MKTRWFFVLVLALLSTANAAFPDPTLIADEGIIKEILSESCAQCHGPDSEQSGSIGYITDLDKLIENRLVVPGNPQESKLLLKILDADDPMPPVDAPDEVVRPTPDKVEIIRKWIAELKMETSETDGKPATNPGPEKSGADQQLVTRESRYVLIESFLKRQSEQSRGNFRFITLENTHNTNVLRPEAKRDLNLYRMAIIKTINSLSWDANIYQPEFVDPERLVLAVDMRRLKNFKGTLWTHTTEWIAIERKYPYGIEPNESSIYNFILKSTGSHIPIVRADWFVTTTTQPDLYHALLGIPSTLQALEKELRVNVEANILNGETHRTGFTKSGVSKNANRLVERHSARYGYYWKSYDFRSGAVKGSLFQFPSGPEFANNPFPDTAFRHDGGEVIFSLPNGMQGYALADGVGARLDAGPADLVSDDKRVTGNPLILNGISCLTCHTEGLKALPKDEIAGIESLRGALKKFVVSLHDGKGSDLVDSDNRRFLAASREVFAPFSNRVFRQSSELIEPITPVARAYFSSDLKLEDVAAEVGFFDVQELSKRIQLVKEIQKLGIGELTKGGVLKRENWEKPVEGYSIAQRLSQELDLGFPVVVATPIPSKK